MTDKNCFLTTKDVTILEVMRDRCLTQKDTLASILNRKIESATIVFRDDIPANVATLNSKVTFCVNGASPETRILSHDRMPSSRDLFLPITTARGLALLGLSEGCEYVMLNGDNEQERIHLLEVQYQPEAAKQRKEEQVRFDVLVPRG